MSRRRASTGSSMPVGSDVAEIAAAKLPRRAPGYAEAEAGEAVGTGGAGGRMTDGWLAVRGRVGNGARVRMGAVELIMPLPGAPKPSLDEPGRLPIPLAPNSFHNKRRGRDIKIQYPWCNSPLWLGSWKSTDS